MEHPGKVPKRTKKRGSGGIALSDITLILEVHGPNNDYVKDFVCEDLRHRGHMTHSQQRRIVMTGVCNGIEPHSLALIQILPDATLNGKGIGIASSLSHKDTDK